MHKLLWATGTLLLAGRLLFAEDANEAAFREAMAKKEAAKKAGDVNAPAIEEAEDQKAEPKAPPRKHEKSFAQRVQEAKAEALKNIKAGVEKALANHPDLAADARAAVSSSTTHETWIEASRKQALQMAGRVKSIVVKDGVVHREELSKEKKEELELNAIRSWTENSAESFAEGSIQKYEHDLKMKIAMAEEAKKNAKKGGQNTAPPNGSVINTPIGGITGPP
ncbi:MAG TPA: hypothetical protein VEJ63_09355 [Planctomycetota bacterium]|nr:hypothetical protein [Planctomycetota bacterium]